MKSEYILYDNSKLEEILKLANEELTVDKREIVKSKNLLISFTTNNNEEKDAIKLFEINQKITSNYKVKMIRNEGLEYAHRKLYAFVNEFEFKIRRFLYLLNEDIDDKEIKKFIDEIESKNFGDIFYFLFIDENYCKNKNKNSNKNKSPKQAFNLEKKAFWNRDFSAIKKSIFKDNYKKLRNYRNDVMHAHNISWEKYKDISNLYFRTNNELDIICSFLIKGEFYFDINEICKGINAFIESESLKKITESIKTFVECYEPKAKNFAHVLNNIARKYEKLDTDCNR